MEPVHAFVLGFLLGGALIGYATYWLATHIGQLRADVARVQGHVEGQGGAVSAAITRLMPGAPVAPAASVVASAAPDSAISAGGVTITPAQLAALNAAALVASAPKPAS